MVKPGSKTCAAVSAAIPGPLSVTEIRTVPLRPVPVRTSIRPRSLLGRGRRLPDRLGRVAQQVDEHLLQLPRVSLDLTGAGLDLRHELDPVEEVLGAHELRRVQ